MWDHNSTDLGWILYFFHFVWSSSFSFGLKTRWFLGEDFFFGLYLFLVRKRVPPRNPAPGATILINTSATCHALNFDVVFFLPTGYSPLGISANPHQWGIPHRFRPPLPNANPKLNLTFNLNPNSIPNPLCLRFSKWHHLHLNTYQWAELSTHGMCSIKLVSKLIKTSPSYLGNQHCSYGIKPRLVPLRSFFALSDNKIKQDFKRYKVLKEKPQWKKLIELVTLTVQCVAYRYHNHSVFELFDVRIGCHFLLLYNRTIHCSDCSMLLRKLQSVHKFWMHLNTKTAKTDVWIHLLIVNWFASVDHGCRSRDWSWPRDRFLAFSVSTLLHRCWSWSQTIVVS